MSSPPQQLGFLFRSTDQCVHHINETLSICLSIRTSCARSKLGLNTFEVENRVVMASEIVCIISQQMYNRKTGFYISCNLLCEDS